MPARVRWGNVGRAAGVVALVALVVAWPRLGAPAVKLPRDAALPVAGESGAHAAPARPERRAVGSGPARGEGRSGRRRIAAVKGRLRRGQARARRRRIAPVKERFRRRQPRPGRRRTAPVRERDDTPAAPSPPPAPPAPPAPPTPPPPTQPRRAPPAPAPAIDPAEREFGFER